MGLNLRRKGKRGNGRKDLCRLTGRIKSVNIDAEIDGFACSNSIPDFLDNASRPNRVDLACLDNLESTVAVIVVVAETGQGGTNTCVDVGIVVQKTFSMRVEEIGAVVDGGLLAWCATEDLGPPGVSLTSQSLPRIDTSGIRLTGDCQNE